MTTETAARTYSGLARVTDYNGWLIDVGKGEFTVLDDEAGSWAGTISVYKGSSLERKLITGLVELADGRRARATVGPKEASLAEDLITVKVHGIDGTIPF